MALLLSLDNGFGNMKLFFKHNGMDYKRDYESRVAKAEIKTDSTLLLDDTLYDFSDAPLITELGHCTKDNPLHRVLRDKALFEAYKITGEKEFDLITNCSLDSFKNDKGESIKRMHEEKKEVTIETYYGEKVTLKVNNILCYAENLAGVIICKKVNLASDSIIAIDIGTKNFQILSLNEAKLLKTYSSTLGMNQIYMDAFDLVKTVNNKIKSPQHVKEYLKRTSNGTFPIHKEIDDAIYKSLKKEIFPQLDNMLQSMDSLFTKYVFIGGGSDYLKRFLERKFREESGIEEIYFTDDSYFANAIGMYKKAESLLKYKDGKKIKKTKAPKKKDSTVKEK